MRQRSGDVRRWVDQCHAPGPLLTITFTNVRPDISHLMNGGNSPELAAVVVSRVVMPIATVEQLVRALSDVVTPAAAAR